MATEPTLATRLQDIQENGAKIQAIVNHTTENLFLSPTNDANQAAVRYYFILIAEAVAAISRHYPAAAQSISDISKIAGFRIHLTHRYYETDPSLVWLNAQQPLSQLMAEVETLLKDQQPAG